MKGKRRQKYKNTIHRPYIQIDADVMKYLVHVVDVLYAYMGLSVYNLHGIDRVPFLPFFYIYLSTYG